MNGARTSIKYRITKHLLIASHGAALSITMLTAYTMVGLSMSALLTVVTFLWFATNKADVLIAYKKAGGEFEKSQLISPRDAVGQVQRYYRSNYKDYAPGFIAGGLAMFYMAYSLAIHYEPSRFIWLIHRFFGVGGVVFFVSSGGVYLIFLGVETQLGARFVRNAQFRRSD